MCVASEESQDIMRRSVGGDPRTMIDRSVYLWTKSRLQQNRLGDEILGSWQFDEPYTVCGQTMPNTPTDKFATCGESPHGGAGHFGKRVGTRKNQDLGDHDGVDEPSPMATEKR